MHLKDSVKSHIVVLLKLNYFNIHNIQDIYARTIILLSLQLYGQDSDCNIQVALILSRN